VTLKLEAAADMNRGIAALKKATANGCDIGEAF